MAWLFEKRHPPRPIGGHIALNRNEPAFYCVPAKAFEAMMDRLDDIALNAFADARSGEKVVKIAIDDL